MKRLLYKFIMGGVLVSVASCQKNFTDLKPTAQFTDAVYFKQPNDFKAFATSFYGQLPGWDFNTMDNNSDLSANTNAAGYDLGHGTIAINTADNWNYTNIRVCNILLAKANEFTGTRTAISQYVSEAHFFRAFAYFNLLKTYGGVPVITSVLDVNSAELQAPRNSRYEVVKQILADLDAAIEGLPLEQAIAAADKGRISKMAAKAFKAQVELYEATWEKYVGKTTDGDGTSIGAGSAGYDAANVNKYLTDAVALCKDVIENGGYAIWNKNAVASMANASSWYLFNLEDAGSNPGGFDKSSNTEFILYNVYDYTLKRGGRNITWTTSQLYPSRKFVDMAVCTDGLPPEKSPLFQGYRKPIDEFRNRDLRLISYLYANGTPPTALTLDFGSLGSSGYGNSKYGVYGFGGRRTDNTESANYPIIRLAEVYLMYAEALVELNGSITDAQLDASINKLRERAAVTKLTNALAAANGLDMLTEIRRERAIEMYREGRRFDDLKRWGILEAALNPSRLGRVVGGASYNTDFKTASSTGADSVIAANYKASTYVFGEEEVQTPKGLLKCIVVDSKLNHSIAKKHYLNPIPVTQISLNTKLLQNPGY